MPCKRNESKLSRPCSRSRICASVVRLSHSDRCSASSLVAVALFGTPERIFNGPDRTVRAPASWYFGMPLSLARRHRKFRLFRSASIARPIRQRAARRRQSGHRVLPKWQTRQRIAGRAAAWASKTDGSTTRIDPITRGTLAAPAESVTFVRLGARQSRI